ncbi:MAG: hypothetical protein LUE31_08505 [Lachnospiraceae bacterium]|nr:hypothetical protein [Lachnospiraceae bacterium]
MSYMTDETTIKLLGKLDGQLNTMKWNEDDSEKKKEYGRQQVAVQCAKLYMQEKLRERKGKAILVDRTLKRTDTKEFAYKIATADGSYLVDVECPVCNCKTQAVHADILKDGIYCWCCGQALKSSKGHRGISDTLRENYWKQYCAENGIDEDRGKTDDTK